MASTIYADHYNIMLIGIRAAPRSPVSRRLLLGCRQQKPLHACCGDMLHALCCALHVACYVSCCMQHAYVVLHGCMSHSYSTTSVTPLTVLAVHIRRPGRAARTSLQQIPARCGAHRDAI